jgi:glycosyltransferase involved in cell wall biosynthesis
MRISVVIPTYNRATIVPRAIESALSQTRPADEVIVVDDGSRDDTASTVARFGDRIRCIRQENGGVSKARNAGVLAATGDWIAFLDSDDVWIPRKLETQVRQLAQHPSAGVHAANGVYPAENGADLNLLEMRGEHELAEKAALVDRPFNRALRCCFLIQGCVARRELLIAAGLFDPILNLFEDMDLFARMAARSAFVMGGAPLVKVMRQGNPSENLSAAGLQNRAFANESLLLTYRKLSRLSGLNRDERRLLEKMTSGARFELAGEQLRMGRKKSARHLLFDSMRDSFGVASVGRAMAGLMLGSRGVEWINNHRASRRPAVSVPGR